MIYRIIRSVYPVCLGPQPMVHRLWTTSGYLLWSVLLKKHRNMAENNYCVWEFNTSFLRYVVVKRIPNGCRIVIVRIQYLNLSTKSSLRIISHQSSGQYVISDNRNGSCFFKHTKDLFLKDQNEKIVPVQTLVHECLDHE